MGRQFEKMVCLVGENPLPIYLCIKQCAKPGVKVVLVHSDETKDQCRFIRDVFGSKFDFESEKLNDPFSPSSVWLMMTALFTKYPDAALCYTGGTKVMSAFGLLAWVSRPDAVVYLDETKRLLRFGDDVDEPLSCGNLDMSALLVLHGVTKGAQTTHPNVPFEDLVNILNHADELPQEMPDKGDKYWIDNHDKEWRVCIDMLSDGGKSALKRSSWSSQYRFFANHEWMEELLKRLVLNLDDQSELVEDGVTAKSQLISPNELVCAQRFLIQKQEFESDLITVYGYRLRYISVTTSVKPKYAKLKSFEAMHRARQIGGDLSRTCVVCLAKSGVIGECLKSVNDPRHTLFGIDDVKKWIAGNNRSLYQFLTS